MSKKKYYIVSEEALPEVFVKVAEAKRMLQVGEAKTVGGAAKKWASAAVLSISIRMRCSHFRT